MPIQHAIDLIRSNKEARGGILLSFLLVTIVLGWMSLAYARLNIYLILISFPMFNAIIVFLISIILIRAENENLTKLRTIPGGVRKTLKGHVVFALIVVIGLNALFEILALLFNAFLIEALSQFLTPIEYTPDPLTLLLIILCNLSFYCCFAAFAIWLFSESKIAPARSGEQLSKLEGFVSVKFILVLVFLVIASLFPYIVVQTAVSSSQEIATVEPVFVVIVSSVYNIVLSGLLWHTAWKTIK
jgi:hypothetical protein